MIGLALPPVAIVMQLVFLPLGQMLVLLLAAVCLFGIGRLIEGYGRP